MPCPALSCLDVSIKYYYLSLSPRLRVLVPPLCVHRDRRPDLTVSGAPSPRFVLFVFSSFILFLCFVSCGNSRWPQALMPADRGRYLPPAVAIPSPPADSLVPGLPLPQAHVSGRSRHRPASDSMPAGPPLTQCPPARR